MGIGKSIQRVDARAKVTGQAKYTQDLMTQPMMVAKVVHSTIANGLVTGFDLDEALKVPGVVKILMCRRLIFVRRGIRGLWRRRIRMFRTGVF